MKFILHPLSFILFLGFLCSSEMAFSAEWPTYRGNNTLDGHVAGKGHITEPKVVWSYFVGTFDSYAVVEPGQGESKVLIPANDETPVSGEVSDARRGLMPQIGDIEGKLQPIASSSTTAYADVLPDVAGLEKIEFESGFSKPTVNGQWQPCVGRCFAWKEGKREKEWETELIDMLF
jgi:hypothetical protein